MRSELGARDGRHMVLGHSSWGSTPGMQGNSEIPPQSQAVITTKLFKNTG